MQKEELEKIIDGYSWIKVKKYDEIPSVEFDSVNDENHYKELLKHHKKETEFLINKCKELAKLLYDIEK